MPSSQVAVVFAANRKGLAKFDVALGPCVPMHGAPKPFVDPLMQDGYERPEQTAALYTVLTGRDPDEALGLVATSGRGSLYIVRTPFMEAMARASDEIGMLIDADDLDDPEGLPRMTAELDRLDRAWLEAGNWPKNVVSTSNRLPRIHLAREAHEKGHAVYCWYGPHVRLAARRPSL